MTNIPAPAPRALAAANVLARRMAIGQASAGTVPIAAIAGLAFGRPIPVAAPHPLDDLAAAHGIRRQAATPGMVEVDGKFYDVEIWTVACRMAPALGTSRLATYQALTSMLNAYGADLAPAERSALLGAMTAYADGDRRIQLGQPLRVDLNQRGEDLAMKAIEASKRDIAEACHVPAELLQGSDRPISTMEAQALADRRRLLDHRGRPIQ